MILTVILVWIISTIISIVLIKLTEKVVWGIDILESFFFGPIKIFIILYKNLHEKIF